MKKRDKLVIAFAIFGLFLLLVGVTYAYFTAIITGKEKASSISLTGGIMQIEYSENSNTILLENIYPRSEAWAIKTITLTGTNTTDLEMKYDLGLSVTTNTFSHYLSYDLTLLEGDNGTPISNITNKAINGTGYKRFGIGVFSTANVEVHKYELKIYLKDNGLNQNEVQNGVFNAKVVVEEDGINDPNEEIAMFLPGQEVNVKMKELAGDDTTASGYATKNTTVTAIQRSATLKEGLTEENVVSTETSAYPIYMWYEDGIIYYYTEADKPYLNSDSSYMFIRFSNMIDISGLSKVVASSATSLLGTFVENLKLTNLHGLENWDVSNVENMYTLFYNAIDLTDISSLSNWNVSNVKNIGYIFAIDGNNYNAGNRSSLTDISALSNWDVSSVTNMGRMFAQNTSLTSLESLADWDVSNVTDMTYTFGSGTNSVAGESKIESLIPLSNWNVGKVTDMFGMFGGNIELTSLDGIENWNTSNVTDMSYMFSKNSNLQNISAVKNWDTSSVEAMSNMFNYDTLITEADIGNWNLNKISSTNNADIFWKCTGLERIKTPKVYPTTSGVVINLPVTLKDSLGTSYTSLSTGSPTQTWLTK